MKKAFALLCGAALCFALLAGCSGGASSSTAGEEEPSQAGSSAPASTPDAAASQSTAAPYLNAGVTAEHLWLDLRGADAAAYWQTADGSVCVFSVENGEFRARIGDRSGTLTGGVTGSDGAFFFSVAFDGEGEETPPTAFVLTFGEDGGISLAQAISSAVAPVYYYSGRTPEEAAANVPGTD